MTAAITLLASPMAAETHKGPHLPVEPWAVGVGIFAVLVLLLLVTLTFGRYRD